MYVHMVMVEHNNMEALKGHEHFFFNITHNTHQLILRLAQNLVHGKWVLDEDAGTKIGDPFDMLGPRQWYKISTQE